MTEKWKRINGFGNKYQVSNLGRIKSEKYREPRILKDRVNSKGYHYVNPCVDGKYRSVVVHRLVALAFVGGDHSLTVNHKDGNKNNNASSNLEWITRNENTDHFVKNHIGKICGEGNGRSVLTTKQVIDIRKLRSEKELTYQKLADRYGVSRTHIGLIINLKRWNLDKIVKK